MCIQLLMLKPIFHCDAKPLALGSYRWLRPPTLHFTQNIPTCWYILALPNAKICVSPDANPRHQSVEYRWHWAFWRWGWRWACTFLFFCVDFISVWCPTRTPFPVEYGLCSSDRSWSAVDAFSKRQRVSYTFLQDAIECHVDCYCTPDDVLIW